MPALAPALAHVGTSINTCGLGGKHSEFLVYCQHYKMDSILIITTILVIIRMTHLGSFLFMFASMTLYGSFYVMLHYGC